jgi:hypothetical protein
MAHIVLLALAAAVFPALIACVAIIISLPTPRALLLAFYGGGLIVSVTAGVIVLGIFKDGGAVLGSTTSAPAPAASIVAVAIALVLAGVLLRRRPSPAREPSAPSWAERHLAGASAAIAFLVGAAINLPGPWYLLALGDIAEGSYSRAQELGLIVLFNAIMFVLLELPLLGYLVRPARTAVLVAAFSNWLHANGMRVTGWFVAAIGLGLLVQGLAAAV